MLPLPLRRRTRPLSRATAARDRCRDRARRLSQVKNVEKDRETVKRIEKTRREEFPDLAGRSPAFA